MNLWACVLVLVLWSFSLEVDAERKACTPPTLKNGRVRIRGGRLAYFRCKKKFKRVGHKLAVCLSRGTWSQQTPVCVGRGCPDLGVLEDVTVKEMYKGGILQFTCPEGMRREGPQKLMCDGTNWDKQPPKCLYGTSFGCDFEDSELCGWSQDTNDDFDWTWTSGITPTKDTGPNGDHTTGSGHYIFMESSAPQKFGQVTRLISPPYKPPSEPMCIEFFYHMKGPPKDMEVGDLDMLIRTGDGGDNPVDVVLFHREGFQADDWQPGVVRIPPQTAIFKIVFAATRRQGWSGDIALDDIRVYNCSEANMTSTTTTAVVTSAVPVTMVPSSSTTTTTPTTTTKTTTTPSKPTTTTKTTTETVPTTTVTTSPTTTTTTPAPPTTTSTSTTTTSSSTTTTTPTTTTTTTTTTPSTTSTTTPTTKSTSTTSVTSTSQSTPFTTWSSSTPTESPSTPTTSSSSVMTSSTSFMTTSTPASTSTTWSQPKSTVSGVTSSPSSSTSSSSSPTTSKVFHNDSKSITSGEGIAKDLETSSPSLTSSSTSSMSSNVSFEEGGDGSASTGRGRGGSGVSDYLPLIVGVSLGLAVGMAVVGVLAWLWARNRRKQKEIQIEEDQLNIIGSIDGASYSYPPSGSEH